MVRGLRCIVARKDPQTFSKQIGCSIQAAQIHCLKMPQFPVADPAAGLHSTAKRVVQPVKYVAS